MGIKTKLANTKTARAAKATKKAAGAVKKAVTRETVTVKGSTRQHRIKY